MLPADSALFKQLSKRIGLHSYGGGMKHKDRKWTNKNFREGIFKNADCYKERLTGKLQSEMGGKKEIPGFSSLPVQSQQHVHAMDSTLQWGLYFLLRIVIYDMLDSAWWCLGKHSKFYEQTVMVHENWPRLQQGQHQASEGEALFCSPWLLSLC